MSDVFYKHAETLLKLQYPELYNNISDTLDYLQIHKDNKNIKDEVEDKGLVNTIKEGICNLYNELNELHNKIDDLEYTNKILQTDSDNLIENKNNIETEYIKIINEYKKKQINNNIDTDTDKQCKICFELDTNVLLNCNHKFCGVCLIQNKNNKCPLCRTEITNKTDIIL
jgi:hypothetical protein